MSPPPLPAPAARPILGIACVVGAALAFSFNDLAMKWLSGDYPLHQITLLRGLVATLVTLALFVPLEGGYGILRTRHLRFHLARGLMVVLANMLLYASVAALPLGEAVAIFYVAPLFITAFSVVFLGEKVGWMRWAAVVVGFAGVLVMMKPGTESFRFAALLPVGSAACYAALQIMTRKLGVAEKAATMAFYIQFMFVLFSAVVGLVMGNGRFSGGGDPSLEFLTRPWAWPTPTHLAIILGVGVAISIAGYLVSQGYRMTEAAILAPFEYVALPVAIFWSIVIWNDWPDAWSWLGIALIAGAGLFVFAREALLGKRVRWKKPLPESK